METGGSLRLADQLAELNQRAQDSVRDPVSKNRVENDQGRHLTSGLFTHLRERASAWVRMHRGTTASTDVKTDKI